MKNSLLMNFSVDKENHEVKVQREFAASRSRVWTAWTESEYLDQWWAPRPWKTETKSMDFREGGHWLYAMVGPEDERHWCRADYKTISPLQKFSWTDAFCDAEGKVTEAFPDAHWITSFTEDAGTTTVNIVIKYKDLANLEKVIEMGFKEGFTAAMENLDELFNRR